MPADLKTCPFCGKPGILHKDAFNFWSVRCGGSCNYVAGSSYADERVAVDQWNKRADNKVENLQQSGEAPVQQAKAAITLLDKLQAWDDGDLPGSINMVDAVISEWRKVKAAVR